VFAIVLHRIFTALSCGRQLRVLRGDGPDNKRSILAVIFSKRLVPEAIVSPAGGSSLSEFGVGQIQE
jgi:hypothetical protein